MGYGGRAANAESAGESLGDEAVDGRGCREGLDAHLRESGKAAGGVAGMQGREDEVSGQDAFDGDIGGVAVADLADHHDVMVVAKDNLESGGEGESYSARVA